MKDIYYIERMTKNKTKEKVYGRFFLEALYGNYFFSKFCSKWFLPLLAKIPFFSYLYAAIQKSRFSRFKIKPFINSYEIETSDFLHPVDSFLSFNDFFIRKLKPSARPLAEGNEIAILPADGRYLFFQNIEKSDGFIVKGYKFSLETLLRDKELAQKYHSGSMVIARLCPVDYHRFHFPCDGYPGKAELINGPLYSVNPIALKQNIHILSENKRMITPLETQHFGKLLFIEVGATYVGSIHQTYSLDRLYKKGEEKGFFSFGGSCIILLFEPNHIQFDSDLLEASQKKIEIQAFYGQSMGKSLL